MKLKKVVLTFVVVLFLSSQLQSQRINIDTASKDTSKNNVIIEKRRAMMKQQGDKKVINVAEMPVAAGGTANDVLKNIPGVEVSIDGGITLRGSQNVTIFIDGRPTSMSGANRQTLLDQIPASSIESIEIVNNPGAKYDAESTAGIINIVLNKKSKEGWSGNVQASYGVGIQTVTRSKWNAGGQLGFANKGNSFYLNYQHRNDPRYSHGDIRRETYRIVQGNKEITKFNNYIIGLNENSNHVLRLGVDYTLNKSSISLNGGLNFRENDKRERIAFEESGYSFLQPLNYERQNSEQNSRANYDVGFNWRRPFKKKGSNISLDLNYSYNNANRQSDFYQFFGMKSSIDSQFYQQNFEFSDNSVFIGAVDYTTNVRNVKFESGIKYTVRNFGNDFLFYNKKNTSEFIYDSTLSNFFEFEDNIFAAYINTNGKWKKLDWVLGLRAENTALNGFLRTTGFSFTRNFLNLFPSAFVTRHFNKWDGRIGYSRRINRPGAESLNPFAELADLKTIRKGNPEILPEMIHSFDIGADVDSKILKWSITGYGRIIEKQFGRFIEVDSNQKATITSVNLSTGYNFGIEANFQYSFRKWLQIFGGANIFRSILSAANIQSGVSNSGMNVSGNLTSNFILSKKMDMQLSARYRNASPTPQGRIVGFATADIAWRYRILNSNGILSINVNDIPDQIRFGINIKQSDFLSSVIRKRETRVMYIQFLYKFGNDRTQKSKPRDQRREEMPVDGF